MELIDLLWEQDMDMGIGRELFDPQYRLQLEKESYLNQQKQLEKEKAQAQKVSETNEQKYLVHRMLKMSGKAVFVAF